MPSDVTFHFTDGPGNTASGQQVSQNFTDVTGFVDDVAAATGVPVPVTNAKMRGSSIIAAAGTRTNAALGALSNGPDQVTGLVVPSQASVIKVRFFALWSSTIANGASAGIFIGSNQAVIAMPGTGNIAQTVVQDGSAGVGTTVVPLTTGPGGLMQNAVTVAAVNTPAPVTTGQILGNALYEGAVTAASGATAPRVPLGGPCEIFNLPAGTYTISIQFSCGGAGTVTVTNRILSCEVEGF